MDVRVHIALAAGRRSRATSVLLLIILALACRPARSQDLVAGAAAPLFASDDPLKLTITLDFDPVFSDRAENRDYQPAMLYYTSDEGGQIALDLGIKTRGFYRLHWLDCDIPPLRLNFKKKQVEGTVFEAQDKLKLVTHCRNRSDRFQQYVFQEYLLYRTYSVLTDASFLTRLVEITYVDSRRRHDPVTKYGFLIEDEDRMAERNGAKLIESGAMIHPEATRRDAMTLLTVFQYMIGNTDWVVTTRHNIRLIYVDATSDIVAVPYDFDWAGIISTPYATPDPQLKLLSVRERRFMGFCRTEDEFAAAFEFLRERQEAILSLFRNFPLLEARYAERSTEYLEDFYETIQQPKLVRRDFDNVCLR
jgi:hypothetical protein